MDIAQIDDDQLEIAIGYNWNADAGKVKIIDGISLVLRLIGLQAFLGLTLNGPKDGHMD